MDQDPSCAEALPSRRVEPPRIGTDDKGPPAAVGPALSITSRFAPSGETETISIAGEGVVSGATSPPDTETCSTSVREANSEKKSLAPSVPAIIFRTPS